MMKKTETEAGSTGRASTNVLRRLLGVAVVALILCAVFVMPGAAWEADTSWYEENQWADEYTIYTADELAGFAELVNTGTTQFYNTVIYLGADIDLENQEWTPINPWMGDVYTNFGGVFDGQGHTISNLTISNQTLEYTGFFGWFSTGSTICNLTLSNVNVSGTGDVGSFIGYLDYYPDMISRVTNCSVIGGTVLYSGEEDYPGSVGGLIGSTRYGCDISYCYAEVTVEGGTSNVGGIVGFVGGTESDGYIGNLTSCSANCTLIGYSSVGGLAGSVVRANITNCFVNSLIKSHSLSTSGGLVGSSNQDTNIINSYSSGSLEFIEPYVSPYARENGGLIGSQDTWSGEELTITNSVSLMQYVYGASPTGRLTGYGDAVIVNSYAWENMTNNGAYFSEGGINGTSVSSSQVWNNQAFFEDTLGWDFENTWKMNTGNENYQLPVLQFMKTPVAGDVSYLLDSASTPDLEDTYIVGIDANYPPFTYIDSDGNPTGFDVESIQWIAEQQGFNVIIQQVDWYGIIPRLLNGEIDMIYSGMSITPERAELVTFSDSYWDFGYSVVVHSDSSATINDFLDGTLVIGVAVNSDAATWLEEEFGTANYNSMVQSGSIKLYDTYPTSMKALENGFVDAVVYNSDSISAYLAGTSTLRELGTFLTEHYAVAMRNDDTALHAAINDGLAELKASEKWDELVVKYFGGSTSDSTPILNLQLSKTSVNKGDMLRISGETTLPAGTNLTLGLVAGNIQDEDTEVVDAFFLYVQKGDAEMNTWSTAYDTSALEAGEYFFIIFSTDNPDVVFNTASFAVTESTTPTPTPEKPAAPTLTPPASLPEDVEETTNTVAETNAATKAEVGYQVKPADVTTLTAPTITRGSLSVLLNDKVKVTKTLSDGSVEEVEAEVLEDGTVKITGSLDDAASVTVNFIGRQFGDVTNDDKVDLSDAISALRVAAELDNPTDKETFYMDVSADSEIDLDDSILLLRFAAELLDENYVTKA